MNDETMKKSPTRRTFVRRQGLLFIVNCLCLLALMLVIRACVATIYTVPDNSLKPFLTQGDRVLVNRLSRHTLGKGDLVVFSDSCSYIGRIETVPYAAIIGSRYRERKEFPSFQRFELSAARGVRAAGSIFGLSRVILGTDKIGKTHSILLFRDCIDNVERRSQIRITEKAWNSSERGKSQTAD